MICGTSRYSSFSLILSHVFGFAHTLTLPPSLSTLPKLSPLTEPNLNNYDKQYLKGFKWEFLTEKFAYERRVREAKLRQAMMTSRKVNAAFVEQVEKNKSRNHALERRRARGDVDGGDAGEGGANGERDLGGKKRKFRQERALASQHGTGSARMSDSVLENVFSSGKK